MFRNRRNGSFHGKTWAMRQRRSVSGGLAAGFLKHSAQRGSFEKSPERKPSSIVARNGEAAISGIDFSAHVPELLRSVVVVAAVRDVAVAEDDEPLVRGSLEAAVIGLVELGDLGGVEALAGLLDDRRLRIAIEVEEVAETLHALVVRLGRDHPLDLDDDLPALRHLEEAADVLDDGVELPALPHDGVDLGLQRVDADAELRERGGQDVLAPLFRQKRPVGRDTHAGEEVDRLAEPLVEKRLAHLVQVLHRELQLPHLTRDVLDHVEGRVLEGPRQDVHGAHPAAQVAAGGQLEHVLERLEAQPVLSLAHEDRRVSRPAIAPTIGSAFFLSKRIIVRALHSCVHLQRRACLAATKRRAASPSRIAAQS